MDCVNDIAIINYENIIGTHCSHAVLIVLTRVHRVIIIIIIIIILLIVADSADAASRDRTKCYRINSIITYYPS